MTFLQNFNNANQFFDIESKKEIQRTITTRVNGWYLLIENILSGLLVLENKLYFLWKGEQFVVTDDFKVEIDSSQNKKMFKLFNGNNILVQFEYNSPDSFLNVSPFEYIDEEDFNWVEFIAQIINNGNRQNNFIKNLMENK